MVTSDFKTGGTWTGAIEQLEKLHLAPVFVRKGPDAGKGNAALIQRGGLPWPEPKTAAELEAAILGALQQTAAAPQQELLRFKEEAVRAYEVPVHKAAKPNKLVTHEGKGDTHDANLEARISELLTEPGPAARIAEGLEISSQKATAQLREMVKRGVLEKVAGSKPVCYRLVQRNSD